MQKDRFIEKILRLAFLLLIGISLTTIGSALPGSGTSSDPYEITTCVDLQQMNEDLDAHYELTQDVNCQYTDDWNNGKGFEPIGNQTSGFRFNGKLDGNNHEVKNLYIDRSQDYVGLFGYTSGNAEITRVEIQSANIDGEGYTGGLAGRNHGNITETSFHGKVSGGSKMGGLVGEHHGILNRTKSTGEIDSTGQRVGGLIGQANQGRVIKSYSRANVTGSHNLGGLVGFLKGGKINLTYSTGKVSGGGLIGSKKNSPTIANSYWDINTSNQDTSAGGTGLTTSDMQNGTLEGFDFEYTWGIDENRTYPFHTPGKGTSSNPFEISTCNQLQEMENNLTAHYELVEDVDCSSTQNWNSGKGFEPVGGNNGEKNPGSKYHFQGTLEGSLHEIENLLIRGIGDNGNKHRGLFAIVGSNGVVRNLHVTAEIKEGTRTGVLAGDNYGKLVNVHTNGVVSTGRNAGGITGVNFGSIKNSSSSSYIKAGGPSNWEGGLAGQSVGSGIIQNSYSTGNVSAVGGSSVGGLVGQLESTIIDSYSTGHVKGGDSNTGGLIGNNNDNSGTVIDSYWDINTSNQSSSAGGTGLTTSDMQNGTLDGFDFKYTWGIDKGRTYPFHTPGNGSEQNPFEISTCNQLQEMQNNLTVHYELVEDVDCSNTTNWNNGKGWAPIGNPDGGDVNERFKGVLDGNMHNIEGLYLSRRGFTMGIFSVIDNSGVVANLTVTEADFGISFDTLGIISGRHYGTITNVVTEGELSSRRKAGGIAGKQYGGETSNSYSEVSIGRYQSGGIVKFIDGGGIVKNTFAIAKGAGFRSGMASRIGGNVLSSFSYSEPGALLTRGSVIDNGERVTDVYYDINSSLYTGDYGIGLRTSQLKGNSSLDGFNYQDTWAVDTKNRGYPYLQDVPVIPQVYDFEVNRLSGNDVNVSFRVGQELDDIHVKLRGPQTMNLTEKNLTHGYNSTLYWTEIEGSTKGEYNATLKKAVSAENGLDGADDEFSRTICDQGTLGTECKVNSTKELTDTSPNAGFQHPIEGENLTIQSNGKIKREENREDFSLNFTEIVIKDGGILRGNVNITADNLTVEKGGVINSTGLGYKGGYPGNGQGAPERPVGNGVGASYGGLGGDGESTRGSDLGPVYGSFKNPTGFGSGGSAWSGEAGDGGGRVILGVNNLYLEGSIKSEGENGELTSCHAPGPGSGGSISITSNEIKGKGRLSSSGGRGSCSGGGGGGRIAINSADTFKGEINVKGGAGQNYGNPGTIYPRDAICDSGNLSSNSDCTLTEVHENSIQNFTGNNLTVTSGAALKGGQDLTLNFSHITVEEDAKITATKHMDVNADSMDVKGKIDVTGRPDPDYSDTNRYLDLNVTDLDVSGGLRANVNVSSDNFTQTDSGWFNASGLGYATGKGPGSSKYIGKWDDMTGGAGHGGRGGTSTEGWAGGDSYGNALYPVSFGSGSGSQASFSGVDGGGRIYLSSNNVSLDGEILVDGRDGYGGSGNDDGGVGGSSGGSIFLNASSLSGSAAIQSSGGKGFNNDKSEAGGGAGGRVAVYTDSDPSEYSLDVNVYGGEGYEDGGDGTVRTPLDVSLDKTTVKDGENLEIDGGLATDVDGVVKGHPLQVWVEGNRRNLSDWGSGAPNLSLAEGLNIRNHAGFSDFDADGRTEAVYLPSSSSGDGNDIVREWNGSEWVQNDSQDEGLRTSVDERAYVDVTMHDFDHDGNMNILIVNRNQEDIVSREWNGNDWESKPGLVDELNTNYLTAGRPRASISVADFDGDNKAEMLYDSDTGNFDSGTGFQWTGSKWERNNSLMNGISPGLGGVEGKRGFDIEDVDGDGSYELFNPTSSGVDTYRWNGSHWNSVDVARGLDRISSVGGTNIVDFGENGRVEAIVPGSTDYAVTWRQPFTNSSGDFSYSFTSKKAGNISLEFNSSNGTKVAGEGTEYYVKDELTLENNQSQFVSEDGNYIDVDETDSNTEVNLSTRVYENVDSQIDWVKADVTSPDGNQETFTLCQNVGDTQTCSQKVNLEDLDDSTLVEKGRYNVTYRARSSLDGSNIFEGKDYENSFYVRNVSMTLEKRPVLNPGEVLELNGTVYSEPSKSVISGTGIGIFVNGQEEDWKWMRESTLPSGFEGRPEIFKINGNFQLVTGGGGQSYSWNGTSWVDNSSLGNGIAYENSRGYTISDLDSDGKQEVVMFSFSTNGPVAREWNGNKWVEDERIKQGLEVEVAGMTSSIIDNERFIFGAGANDKISFSQKWKGYWETNNSAINGISTSGSLWRGNPSIKDWNGDNREEILIGTGRKGKYGDVYSYQWYGTEWKETENELPDFGQYTALEVENFDGDDRYEALIKGESGGFQYFWTQPVTSSGEWTYNLTAPERAGTYDLKINTTDRKGIYGENSTKFNVTLPIQKQSAEFEASNNSHIDVDSSNQNVNLSAFVGNSSDSNVDMAWAEVESPDGSTETFFLDSTEAKSNSQTWFKSVDIASYFTNNGHTTLGRYNVSFYANTTRGIGSEIKNTSFYVENVSIEAELGDSKVNLGEELGVSGEAELRPYGDSIKVNPVNLRISNSTWNRSIQQSDTLEWRTENDWNDSTVNRLEHAEFGLAGNSSVELGVNIRRKMGEDLELWYTMDEEDLIDTDGDGEYEEIYDRSGKGNNGTLNGDMDFPELTTSNGTALTFDGSDDWIKTSKLNYKNVTAYTSFYADEVKRSYIFTAKYGNLFRIQQSNEDFRAQVSSPADGRGIKLPANKNPVGSWVSALQRTDAVRGEVDLFVNGELRESKSVSPIQTTSIYPNATLGSRNGLYLFSGKISKATAWNRSLTQAEIKKLEYSKYNGSLTTSYESTKEKTTELSLSNLNYSLNNGSINLTVQSDHDGDGVVEENASEVSLDGGESFEVPGLSKESDRFRLFIELESDSVTKSPVFSGVELDAGEVTGGSGKIEYQNRIYGGFFNESFEDNGVEDWTGDNYYLKSDESYEGGFSIGSAGQGSLDAELVPEGWSGGVKPDTFEYYWWERTDQSGHTVSFIDSGGSTVVNSGSNNPEWELTGGTVESSFSDDYRAWVRYQFDFDWKNCEYDYNFTKTTTGLTETGTRNLKSCKDMEKIRLSDDIYGSADHVRFDGFQANFSESVKSGFKQSDTVYRPSEDTPVLKNVDATLNGGSISLEVGSDHDGDDVVEAWSEPISLDGSESYNVEGLSEESSRFRYRINFSQNGVSFFYSLDMVPGRKTEGRYRRSFEAPIEPGNYSIKVNTTDRKGVYGENETTLSVYNLTTRIEDYPENVFRDADDTPDVTGFRDNLTSDPENPGNIRNIDYEYHFPDGWTIFNEQSYISELKPGESVESNPEFDIGTDAELGLQTAIVNASSQEEIAAEYSLKQMYLDGKKGDSLVGFWRFNSESGEAKDYSGENNDGSVGSDVVRGVEGKFGSSSFEVGESEGVEVPFDQSLNFSESRITVSAWIYLDDRSVAKQGILRTESRFSNGLNTCRYHFGNLQCTVWNNGDSVGMNSGEAIPEDEWTHVVFTLNGTDARMYQDGKLAKSEDLGQEMGTPQSGDPVKIGYGLAGKGRVDEVRLYNRSLSEDEVKDLYNPVGRRISVWTRSEPDFRDPDVRSPIPRNNSYWQVSADVYDEFSQSGGARGDKLSGINTTFELYQTSEQGDSLKAREYVFTNSSGTSVFNWSIQDYGVGTYYVRAITNDMPSKYINSTDSPVFTRTFNVSGIFEVEGQNIFNKVLYRENGTDYETDLRAKLSNALDENVDNATVTWNFPDKKVTKDTDSNGVAYYAGYQPSKNVHPDNYTVNVDLTKEDYEPSSFNTSIEVRGKLNITNNYHNSGNNSSRKILTRGTRPMLNSTVLDEYGANVAADVNWSIDGEVIASGIESDEYVNASIERGNNTLWANATEKYYDSDQDSRKVKIYGLAEIANIYPPDADILPGTEINVKANISDVVTNQPVEGMPVRFYENGSQVADVLTNSSGIAEFNWTPDEGYKNLTAEISDNSSILYNVSEFNESSLVEIDRELYIEDINLSERTVFRPNTLDPSSVDASIKVSETDTDATRKPADNKMIYFRLDGNDTYSCRTDSSGICTATINPTDLSKPGNNTLEVIGNTSGYENDLLETWVVVKGSFTTFDGKHEIVEPSDDEVVRGESVNIRFQMKNSYGEVVDLPVDWSFAGRDIANTSKDTEFNVGVGESLGSQTLSADVISPYYYEAADSDSRTLEVWGKSYVTLERPDNETEVGYGETPEILCSVEDQTGSSLSGYPVEFFQNNTILAEKKTNFRGEATVEWDVPNRVNNYSVGCRIADNATMNYRTYDRESSKLYSTTDDVPPDVENLSVTPEELKPGQSISINYTASDQVGIVDTWVEITDPFFETERIEVTNNSGVFEATFTTDNSIKGTYTAVVKAEDTNGNIGSSSGTFKTSKAAQISIEPSEVEANRIRIDSGQNYTTNVTVAADADLNNLNVSINISDRFRDKISYNSSNKECGNISIGGSCSKQFDLSVTEGVPPQTMFVNFIARWSNKTSGNQRFVKTVQTVQVQENPVMNASPSFQFKDHLVARNRSYNLSVALENLGNYEVRELRTSFNSSGIPNENLEFLDGSVRKIPASSSEQKRTHETKTTLFVPYGLPPGNYTANLSFSGKQSEENATLKYHVDEYRRLNITPKSKEKTIVAGQQQKIATLNVTSLSNVNVDVTGSSCCQTDSKLLNNLNTSFPPGTGSTVGVSPLSTYQYDIWTDSDGVAETGSYDLDYSFDTGISSGQYRSFINVEVVNLSAEIETNISQEDVNIKSDNSDEIQFTVKEGDLVRTQNLNFSIGLTNSTQSLSESANILSKGQSDGVFTLEYSYPDLEDARVYDLILTVEDSELGVDLKKTIDNKYLYRDVTKPEFNSIDVEDVFKGERSKINVSASDNSLEDIRNITYTIQLPESTRTLYLNKSGRFWTGSFVPPETTGDYKGTMKAIDASYNNRTVTEYFRVGERSQLTGRFESPGGSPLSANIILKDPETGEEINTLNISESSQYSFDIKSGRYDATIETQGSQVTLENANITGSDPIKVAELSGSVVPSPSSKSRLMGVAVKQSTDPASGEIVFNYSEYKSNIPSDESIADVNIGRCTEFNYTDISCEGEWTKLNKTSFNVDKSSETVTASVPGFSIYSLYYPEEVNEQLEDVEKQVEQVQSGIGGLTSNLTELEDRLNSTEGGSGEGSGSGAEGLQLSSQSITAQIKPGEEKRVSVSLTNGFNEPQEFSFSSSSALSQFVDLPENVELEPGESRDVLIEISTEPGATPSAYSGYITINSRRATSRVPTNIDIVPPDKELLDLVMNPVFSQVEPGETARIEVTLNNQGYTRNVDVNVRATLVNPETNQTLTRKSKTMAVETTLTRVMEIEIPENAELGRYEVRGSARYSNLEVPMVATSVSTVSVKVPFWERQLFGIVSYMQIAIALVLILITSVAGYAAYQHHRKKVLQKKRYREQIDLDTIPTGGSRQGFIGELAEMGKRTFTELESLKTHALIAGATGSGKTVTGQVIVEEALKEGVNVIVLDPTAQWSGYLRECDEESMIQEYDEFGLSRTDTTSFDGNIRAIEEDQDEIDIKSYLQKEDDEGEGEIIVFSMHKLSNANIDEFIASTIEQVFEANLQESEKLNTLIVYDEAHRILGKFGGSGEGVTQLERGAREFRKWGVGMILLSQVVSDFPDEVRANINTTIQMRTQYDGDLNRLKEKFGMNTVQSVAKAEVGSGMLHNSSYNHGRPYFVNFRPMLHSPHRLSDQDLDKYEEYNRRIDKMAQKIDELEQDGKDVYEYRNQLDLSRKNLRQGSFNLVDIYLDELKDSLPE